MKIKHTLSALFLSSAFILSAQQKATATIEVDQGKLKIEKHIYGHFAEHLGNCIYGGIYVGENSPIPNTNGVRNDIIQLLKDIKIPNLRWPGGCFADEYHWKDGIGPKENRPKMVNTHWGGVTEDNSFGTHEFLNLCEVLGTEPYISANVGSGTVQEMSQWVEYINFDGISPMTELRKKNGREKPWNVKFWGVGNESWGCGGNMKPEYYANEYRRYATFCRDYPGRKLLKIACGANDHDTRWTDVVMGGVGRGLQAISLHYYTLDTWGKKGSATDFDMDHYYTIMNKCLETETVLKKQIAVMDKHDPAKKVALIVDEWGTWFDVIPGTNPGFLRQQNTLRDAFVAAISLNIFNTYCERVKMANIAQTVNVLQSLIMTEGEKLFTTPTYHIFNMYKYHQDATLLPSTIEGHKINYKDKNLPAINMSASKSSDGYINITLVNIDPEKTVDMDIALNGLQAKGVTGEILTAKELNSMNTFEKPEEVKPVAFKGAKLKKDQLSIKMPAKSVVLLRIK